MDQGRETQSMELREYLRVLRRRKGTIAAIFLFFAAAGVTVASVMPPVYRSTATILIERQEIPQELVDTTVTGYVQERIQTLTRRLLTPDRLAEIAERTGYTNAVEVPEGPASLIDRIKDGIEIDTVNVQATNPGNGRKTVATVAFTVAFDAPTPEVAQRGADALAKLYLQEDRRSRTQQAEEVSAFLEAQAEQLNARIAKLEKELARFKQKNVEQLPEHSELNMRLLEQADNNLERTEERIATLNKRRIQLESRLAVTEPALPVYDNGGERLMTVEEQLSYLRSEYLSAKTRYSDNHPDVKRLEREISALEQRAGVRSRIGGMRHQLETLRARLGELRKRYSDRHPDVRKQQRQIAELEKSLAAEQAKHPNELSSVTRPTNPAYIQLETELETVNAELESERTQRDQLRTKRAELEQRLYRTPAVEKDYLAISRDYQNALKKYREVRDKLLQAQAAEQLERTNQAQRLSLVAPPTLPTAPEKPNRRAITVIGLMLGLGGGIGTATVAEYLDRTVRGVRGVLLAFGAPPLAAIPVVESRSDLRRRRARRWLGAITALLMIVLVVITVHHLWMPLDDLWRAPATESAPPMEGVR